MLIIGAGGHAKEILDIIEEGNDENLFFFDNLFNNKREFFGYPVLKSFSELELLFKSNKNYVLGFGGTIERLTLVNSINLLDGNLVSVISHRAMVSRNSYVGKGVNIMPFSSVFRNARVNEGVIINSYSSVHHDSEVGKFSELSPGSRILGKCKIGQLCRIGTNAVVLPGLSIGENVIIGAGSVVTKSIRSNSLAYGAPARVIRELKPVI